MVLLLIPISACGDEARNDVPATPDGGTEASGDGARPDGDETGTCPNQPVMHGMACSTEGAKACGHERECTDVGTNRTTTCTCTNGRYDCGDCPHCPVNLNVIGCGIGQVCDAVTFQLCDGTTVSAESCTCLNGGSWRCGFEDGGEREYPFCPRDGGTSDVPETSLPETSLPEAGDGGDARPDGDETVTCPSQPVMHGMACSTEGAKACGHERECTDIGTNRTTTCTCTNGRYRCGDCPHCPVNLNAIGCGVGQVCDAVTFQLCDGTTVSAESCTCWAGTWRCEDADGGQRQYPFCPRDGGTSD